MSTTTITGKCIQITNVNLTSDWKLSNTDFDGLKGGIGINYMMYTPGASRDIVVIKEDNDAGAQLVKFECANSYDQKIVYFHGRQCRPYIDISAGSKGKKSTSILSIFFD